MHDDHDHSNINAATTRHLAQLFLDYWSVQDAASTVTLLADNIVSIVNLAPSSRGMSGRLDGIDAVTEGLYRSLATWHYLKFTGRIVRVQNDLASLQIEFEYEHQTTALRYVGSMRKIIQVQGGKITRVEAHHDSARINAWIALVQQREAELLREQTDMVQRAIHKKS